MNAFTKPCVEAVKIAEGPGGDSDDGGLTVYGICMRWDPTWAGWAHAKDLLNAGGEWHQDPKLLADVSEFYETEWDAAGMDRFANQALAQSYFGGYVNEGPKVAKGLQEAAGVSQDGLLGPETFAAVDALDPEKALLRFQKWRVMEYVSTLPADEKGDLPGLINRVYIQGC